MHETRCNKSGTSLDSFGEAVRDSLKESSSDGVNTIVGNEGSDMHETRWNKSGTSLDSFGEAVRDSLMESSSGRVKNMTGNEGSDMHETRCNKSGTSLDSFDEAVRDSLMESSSGRVKNMTGNEGSDMHETRCNKSGTSLDSFGEAVRDSLKESSSDRVNTMVGNEGSDTHETPCSNGDMKSVDPIREPVKNLPDASSPSRRDKIMDEESFGGKAAFNDMTDAISESVQNSRVKSSHSDTDDKTENEESRNKTPCRDDKTKPGDPISEAVQNSLTNIFTAIDDKSSNEESHGNKNPCNNSEMTSVDPMCETIQNSSMEIFPSGTDDKTNNEETPCKLSEAEAMDPVSGAVQNSLMESSPSRIDDEPGNEECGQDETPWKQSGIDTDTKTNDIRGNKAMQKRTASRGRCSDANRKRKYQHMSSNDDKANFCGHAGGGADTVRTDRPSADCSGSSSVMLPVTKLQKTEITVDDFTTLVNSAVQKKLVKPCFVSVVKFSRNN
jgi:flavin-binding protein dodecin